MDILVFVHWQARSSRGFTNPTVQGNDDIVGVRSRVGNVATLQGRQTDRKPHFSAFHCATVLLFYCSVYCSTVPLLCLLCSGDIALGTKCWEYPHLLLPCCRSQLVTIQLTTFLPPASDFPHNSDQLCCT